MNQQFSNRLSDVPASGSWRYMCEIEMVSSPSPTASMSPSPTPTFSTTPSFGSTLTSTLSASPSPSPSSLCQPGWSRYINDGSELSDSCLQASSSSFSTWTAASVGCPAGSHMITVRSSIPASGLAAFVRVSVTAVGLWIGASQSSSALYRNRGWMWLDGTGASNLNCGTNNAVSCGVWETGGPE